MRENRIKSINFPIGSLTSSAGGIIDVYSEQPFNGTIKKIQFQAGNWAAAGSVWVNISGAVAEQIWFKKTAVNADSTVYPLVFGTDSTNATGSPAMFTEMVNNSKIGIIASGLGGGKSGLGLTIYYI